MGRRRSSVSPRVVLGRGGRSRAASNAYSAGIGAGAGGVGRVKGEVGDVKPVIEEGGTSGRGAEEDGVREAGQGGPGGGARTSAGPGAGAGTAAGGVKKGKKWRLEEVERWTMVKRIW